MVGIIWSFVDRCKQCSLNNSFPKDNNIVLYVFLILSIFGLCFQMRPEMLLVLCAPIELKKVSSLVRRPSYSITLA